MVPLAAAFAAQAQQQPAPTTAPQQHAPATATDTRNPGVIQLMNQIEALQAEINRLHGQIEVLTNGLDNAQKRQRDMYLDLDTRLRRIEQGAGAGSPRSEAPAKPEGAAATAAGGPPADADERLRKLEQQSGADSVRARDAQPSDVEPPRVKRIEQPLPVPGTAATGVPPAGAGQTAAVPRPVAPTRPTPPAPPSGATAADQNIVRKAYDTGLGSYRSGDYQGAIAAFDGIVKRYPRDPLAPNAQYWIGDSWFNLRDFRSAAAAQQLLVNNYPDSPKVPDALLNLSSAYAALGEIGNARKTLEELIARFPQSDAAEKGRQRLSRLR
jgi:tol-pal system protein YbgF